MLQHYHDTRILMSVINGSPLRQVDRDEVRLRRTIGLKKDEYFLDKKHIT